MQAFATGFPGRPQPDVDAANLMTPMQSAALPAQERAGRATSQATWIEFDAKKESIVMAMSEERKLILRMIEEGTISAEEGTRLLGALNEPVDEADPAQQAAEPANGRFIRIRVTDLVTGRQKVNVSVPLGLLNFIWRFVPEDAGVDVQELRKTIDSGFTGRLVEVEDVDDGQHVEIYID